MTWIACGAADAEEIRRVIAHNRGVRVETLFDDTAPLERFLHQLARHQEAPARLRGDRRSPRSSARPSRASRRATSCASAGPSRSSADHVYVDSDGVKADSPITRVPVPPFSGERARVRGRVASRRCCWRARRPPPPVARARAAVVALGGAALVDVARRRRGRRRVRRGAPGRGDACHALGARALHATTSCPRSRRARRISSSRRG